MKKLLFLLTVALATMSMWAAPVDQAAALRKAQSYLANELYAGKIMAPAAMQPVLVKTELSDDVRVKHPVYYIYNTSTTYVVVSGDDRAEDILMVGDAPLDINNIPIGMQDMLYYYKQQIEFLHNNPSFRVKKSEPNTTLRATTYGPLLKSKWDQTDPYYKLCKFTYNGTSYQCYTGCPATSAAQVMYYWKYPEGVDAMASYTRPLELNSYNSVNYTYPALDATTFDWGNMLVSYGYYYDNDGVRRYQSYNTAQGNAVATLMRYVGQAEQMMYGTAAAGGSGIYTNENYLIVNMYKNWGYKTSVKLVQKTGSYSSDNAWKNVLITEMAASRPIVFTAVSNDGGHAFNVDGYRDSDTKFHVNFGWNGSGDGWMAINAFTDGDGATFNQGQQAIVGIEAPNGIVETPELNVSTNSLTFTGEVGQSYTQTFTVTAANLVNDVTLTSSNSQFVVSPTTLTKAQAQAGATITVTYAPTAAAVINGTLTVASVGAGEQTITLKGTATVSTTPIITVDPTSLDFETTVGTPVQKTFFLKGYNLTKMVYLSVSGTGFTISKTNSTASGANNGVTVTVTYNPTTSGTHTGAVTITSTGAETVTLPLTGTAIGSPTITASPTSLSFSTTPGTAVTKTFTVNGSDLTGNVSLAVSGTGFSINKTSIPKNDALNGTTVTVTYNPTAGGNHTGTVTLTSPGASNVTVNLTGSSVVTPTLTVNPTSLSMNTVVGTPVTKTFTVNGTNLTNTVTLSVSGAGFSIDKNNITPSGANNGTTVTVTYNPTTAGNHTGTVTLNSTGAQSVTVALNGSATEPPRTITVNPTSLNMTAATGEEVSATFNVSGQNLTGNLTLTLTDPNGVYYFGPTTISAAAAMAGNVPVTVYYAPSVAGTQNAIINISGGGATAVNVALKGTAYLAKYTPVMLPAVEEYINFNKFRADWTDETPEPNVESYTLEVSAVPTQPVIPVELIGSIDGTSYTNQNYQAVTLTAPWSGENVYGGYGAIYFRNATHQDATTDGYIKYTIPADYQNIPFTVKITTASTNYGSGRFVVGSTQTAAVTYSMTAGETHSWLVTGSAGDVITITSPEDQYSPDIATIEIYTGDATVAALRANENGDQNYRLITGITDKFYTVNNLAEYGTFLYKVKAIYIDGTESDWSNEQEVTLFDNGHGYALGDVNHDNYVNISDVIALINQITGTATVPCQICADYNQDGLVNISDVISMISFIQSGAKFPDMEELTTPHSGR